jgi:site-specific recombinase XerD
MVPAMSRDLVQNTIPLVEWQLALQTFLNTLGSPRTAKACRRVVREAMETLDVEYVADVTASDLAQYRGSLDMDNPDRLSPATINLKLVGLRQFLHFCLVRHYSSEQGCHSVRPQEPQSNGREALPGAKRG